LSSLVVVAVAQLGIVGVIAVVLVLVDIELVLVFL
jgi:hypothetical protein